MRMLAVTALLGAAASYALLLTHSKEAAQAYAPICIVVFLCAWGYLLARLERTHDGRS